MLLLLNPIYKEWGWTKKCSPQNLLKIPPRPWNQTDKLAASHLMWKEEIQACQAISIRSNTCAKWL